MSRSSIKSVSLTGGTALLISDTGAFWVSSGRAHASNGTVKAWAPHLDYADAEKAGVLQVQYAVK